MKPLLFNTYEAEPLYAVEGEALLLEKVAELSKEIQHLKPCFLGYTPVEPQGKLKAIKNYTGPAIYVQWSLLGTTVNGHLFNPM